MLHRSDGLSRDEKSIFKHLENNLLHEGNSVIHTTVGNSEWEIQEENLYWKRGVEHLRRFHGMDNAKEIWEAIRTSSEGLEKGYDRFQQLLSQLEAHGAGQQELTSTSKSSASAQNVAFVSHSKSSTNKVKSGHNVIYSLFAKQSEDFDLLHEDLEQIDDVDIERWKKWL
ncbi:hypothetical protein Tco_0304185 [Tanacetum coccineum]